MSYLFWRSICLSYLTITMTGIACDSQQWLQNKKYPICENQAIEHAEDQWNRYVDVTWCDSNKVSTCFVLLNSRASARFFSFHDVRAEFYHFDNKPYS